MPVFFGATDNDVLTRHSTAEFFARLQRNLDEVLAHLPPGADLTALGLAGDELAREIAFDEAFAADFARRMAALDAADDPAALAAELTGLREVIAGYFSRRQAVLALHRHCMALVDRVTAAALRLALRWLEESGVGQPPASWCWMTAGVAGRGEGSLSGEYDALLVYDAAEGEDNSAVVGLAGRAVKILEQLGFASRRGMMPTSLLWRASPAEWRKRLRSTAAEGEESLEVLARLADLRFVVGDSALADDMVALVRTVLTEHEEAFLAMARRVAMAPTGFDFFGRLKVARAGEHRGLFNLSAAGLDTLVATIRLLALRHGITAVGTMARIQALLHEGQLNVDLAGRLLEAAHLFERYAGNWQIGSNGQGRDVLVNPEELSPADERALKGAVETVGSLQKIVYSSIVGQG